MKSARKIDEGRLEGCLCLDLIWFWVRARRFGCVRVAQVKRHACGVPDESESGGSDCQNRKRRAGVRSWVPRLI